MRLIFARHAESEANVANTFLNRDSRHPLTATGRAQAQAFADRIAAEPLTTIYASPIARAQETASFVSDRKGLPVIIEAGLREYDVGILEGKTHAEALPEYNRVEAEWLQGELSARIEGGESAVEIIDRMNAVLKSLKAAHAETDTILLVSHGGTLRTSLPRLLTGLTTTMTLIQLGHCETAVAELVNRRFVARSWGPNAIS
jgi:probable phosphoglycerate mutase